VDSESELCITTPSDFFATSQCKLTTISNMIFPPSRHIYNNIKGEIFYRSVGKAYGKSFLMFAKRKFRIFVEGICILHHKRFPLVHQLQPQSLGFLHAEGKVDIPQNIIL
jgi:hypothetical protein